MNYTDVFGAETVPATDEGYKAFVLTADTTWVWRYNSDGDLTVADLNHVSVTGTVAITLPGANLVSVGESFVVRNTGITAFDVKDAAGSMVATLAAGDIKQLTVIDNSTSAGVWSIFTLGAGTAEADASELNGSGLKVEGAKLAQDHVINPQTGDYTAVTTDRAKLIDFSSSGAVTLTLPQSEAAGFFLIVHNSGSGAVTLTPDGGLQIDGQSSLALAPGESLSAHRTSAGWVTVGYGRSTSFDFTKLVLSASVDFPGNTKTLSTVEAANKLIQVVGTAAAALTLIVPSTVSVYFTQMAYAGAFSLTVKTAAGTGTALNNSDRSILYCDGTNVVSAQTAPPSSSTISVSDGTAGSPTVTFASENNTGIYRPGANQWALSVGGARRLLISTTLASFTVPVNTSDGTAGSPTVTFASENNTGIYRPGANQWALSVGGARRLLISTTLASFTVPVNTTVDQNAETLTTVNNASTGASAAAGSSLVSDQTTLEFFAYSSGYAAANSVAGRVNFTSSGAQPFKLGSESNSNVELYRNNVTKLTLISGGVACSGLGTFFISPTLAAAQVFTFTPGQWTNSAGSQMWIWDPGITGRPIAVQWFLECVTAEFAFDVGDQIDITNHANVTTLVTNNNDVSNPYDLFFMQNGQITVKDKTTAATVRTLTSANWKLGVRAIYL